ncbi:Diguanylate cyclase [Vibrio rotiferianus]|uniref:diguanylate cyclase n=1 Tax=Vibrio rotiferianus TaxID=190895 RepID=UPI002894739A|nr:Diguanylate cyclase [Vibrio rotiferianus]CAH1554612.1 Diguanylate cyclase [Vibrio rotiferianus]CAH1556483.1 Diguanylate cyclase [Vibrio rotiferianus]
MRYSSKKRYGFALFFLTFIACCIGGIELFQHNQHLLLQERLQVKAREKLSVIRSNLEAEMMADIYATSTLATLVTLSSSPDASELEDASNRILLKSNHIEIIGIAQNDVIQHVYPTEGNERIIGLDYRKVPEQWTQIQKARDIEEIFISGPVNLVQGGRGLIVRVPVFVDPPKNNEYWGSISTVINMESLLRTSGVLDYSMLSDLVIRGYNSMGSQGDIFFGDKSNSKEVIAAETVRFPYGSWALEVYESRDLYHKLPWYELNVARLIGYPVLFFLGFFVITIYRLYLIADSRAFHDELTKLPNRRYFMKSYRQQFEIAKRYDKHYDFALINIDLDRFKHINDTYGHDAGDKVLVACADRIKNSLRRSDIVARMGGDEFLVMMHNPKSEDNIQNLLQKLRYILSSTPVIYEDELIYIRVSMGYAIFQPSLMSAEQMMKIADERMYKQKHFGL